MVGAAAAPCVGVLAAAVGVLSFAPDTGVVSFAPGAAVIVTKAGVWSLPVEIAAPGVGVSVAAVQQPARAGKHNATRKNAGMFSFFNVVLLKSKLTLPVAIGMPDQATGQSENCMLE